MIGLKLFARSKRWFFNTVAAVVCGILIVACGPLGYALNPEGGYRVALSAQVPLLAAVTIQASMATSLHAQEAQSARRMTVWRLFHVIALTLLAATIIAIAATQLQPPSGVMLNGFSALGPGALARNLVALTGAGLICSTITGPAFAWVLPVAWAIVPFLMFSSPDDDSSGVLTLLVQPDSAFLPAIVAIAAWTLGTMAVSRDWTCRGLVERCGRGLRRKELVTPDTLSVTG